MPTPNDWSNFYNSYGQWNPPVDSSYFQVPRRWRTAAAHKGQAYEIRPERMVDDLARIIKRLAEENQHATLRTLRFLIDRYGGRQVIGCRDAGSGETQRD